jgi:hypothetical protein
MNYQEVIFSLKSVLVTRDRETFATVEKHAHPADIASVRRTMVLHRLAPALGAVPAVTLGCNTTVANHARP